LKEEEINIYQFPECDSDEDEDFKRQDAEMKVGEAEEGAEKLRRHMWRWKFRKRILSTGVNMPPAPCPVGKHSFRSRRFK
jgi:hypothetical protein